MTEKKPEVRDINTFSFRNKTCTEVLTYTSWFNKFCTPLALTLIKHFVLDIKFNTIDLENYGQNFSLILGMPSIRLETAKASVSC